MNQENLPAGRQAMGLYSRANWFSGLGMFAPTGRLDWCCKFTRGAPYQEKRSAGKTERNK